MTSHITRARALVAVLALAASAHAAGQAYLPGGEAVKAAVASRQGKTELSKLAAAMKPGTWAELKTTIPPKLWTSPPPSRGLHIAGWTDDAHWDSLTGQFLYMGLRQTRQFIAYAETNNAWRVIALDKKSDNPCFQTAFGHIYSSNGFDHERSQFYHRYNGFKDEKAGLNLAGGISWFDVVTEKWTKLPSVPNECGFTGMAIEYFGAMDGLAVLGKRVFLFSAARQKWEDLGPSPVDGYHSLIRHNPYRKEVLMAGGNNNPLVVARITAEGKIERLKEFPVPLSVRHCRVSVDPVSGRYLILAGGDQTTPRTLYEFDSNRNEYRVSEPFTAKWPYGRYAMPVCAFIPEYGVIMWAEPTGVFLYKHETVGEK